VTASPVAQSRPKPSPVVVPPAHLPIEVLRRPVEFTQYTSIAFTDRLIQAGADPSVGSVGDAYDNALAETTIGLYKTECTRPGSPFHTGITTLGELEAATAAWVHWYNTARLMHRLGLRPPTEALAEYYAQPHHPAAHK